MGFLYCNKTPPNPIPLASHSSSKVFLKLGSWRRGACANLSFKMLKEFSCALPQKKGTPFFVNSCNGAEILHEATIESSKSQKASHLGDGFGDRPPLNGLHFCLLNFNSLWSDNKAKKRDSIRAKCALLKITKKTCIS